MYTSKETQLILSAMADRKSTKALGEKTPSDPELAAIFAPVFSVADHHQKHPYRFIVMRKKQVKDLAETAGKILNMKNPERHKYANKANMAIAIVFKHKKESSTPKWEQFVAASGAATLLSTSLWAANWASHWVSMKDQNNKALRKFHNLKKREELLGWIFVGDWAKPEEQTKPKKRPSFDDYVSFM